MIRQETSSYDISNRKWQGTIEDDGLPAQIPPSVRIHLHPDDPSQPWSINYGRQEITEVSASKVPFKLNQTKADFHRVDPVSKE